MPIIVTAHHNNAHALEIVGRKGIGHPDTICDALAEQLFQDLCNYYYERFGGILHHNVDKALLVGGRSAVAFGTGRIEEPIDIYLAGLVTTKAGNQLVPVGDIAQQGARRWLRENLHALDADSQVRIRPVLRPRTEAFRDVFIPDWTIPRARSTAFGVGYAPLSPLEQLVMNVERGIVAEIRAGRRRAWGEDIKVLGVRLGRDVRLTISCAMIGPDLEDLDAYVAEVDGVKGLASAAAEPFGFDSCEVRVNPADQPRTGDVFLTVTGTSAEAGDDGEVGRGNRINGLMTPGRPMCVEAAAGKNPVSHVGKIYNVTAQDIARRVVGTCSEAVRADCTLVSRIGAPITDPAVIELCIETADGGLGRELTDRIYAIISDSLAAIPHRVKSYLTGEISVY
jgi:S-adenosylmethionine synthetase